MCGNGSRLLVLRPSPTLKEVLSPKDPQRREKEDRVMTGRELAERKARATEETFVISQAECGYRVYAPTEPKRSYIVSRDGDRLACSCADFLRHEADPDWQCKHVLAVNKQFGNEAPKAQSDSESEKVRQTAKRNGKPAASPATTPQSGAQMFLKRSVSPDGRIDSFSVGFTWPVDTLPGKEVVDRIEKTLVLQETVVARFRKQNGQNGNAKKEPAAMSAENGSSQAALARMVAVGGMDGRWGRRLFITIEADGKLLRLFGTEKRLGDAIKEAGFPDVAKKVAEGLSLDLPCRVVTVPSPDGRFQNVERVLPAQVR